MKRKRVVILGATGSIGESALKVARDIPEQMEIVGVAANSNAEKLAAAANETRAPFLCLVDETKMEILRRALAYKPRIFSGEAGLREIACLADVDMVLVAIVGTGGLRPALAAIKAGKDLAVASKETPSTMPFFNAWKVGGALVPPKIAALRPFPHFNLLTSDASSSRLPADHFAKSREKISIPSHQNRH
jgi:1-deoxy-D-xylulose 5-phosphate reductoisomerase